MSQELQRVLKIIIIIIKADLKDEDKGFYITTKERLSELEIENVFKKLAQLLEKGKKSNL